MGQHSNPSSRYKNRRNQSKKNEEMMYSRQKKRKELEKQKKKTERKFEKKKITPSFPEEFNIVNTTSTDCLYLRIPVKWSLFGKLKDRSQILFNNVLTKNFTYIGGCKTIEKTYEADFDLNRVRRKDLLLDFRKRSKMIVSNQASPMAYTKNNLKAFTYKHGKTWYIYFPLKLENLFMTNLAWYNAVTNYIELKTHVYDQYSTKKYKIKGHDRRCHLDLALVYNLGDIKRGPAVYHLDNIYPKVIKSEDDKRDINCIYRIYTYEEHDLADPEMTVQLDKSDYYTANFKPNKPERLYVYAIPNVVRYKRPFNRDKLPKELRK